MLGIQANNRCVRCVTKVELGVYHCDDCWPVVLKFLGLGVCWSCAEPVLTSANDLLDKPQKYCDACGEQWTQGSAFSAMPATLQVAVLEKVAQDTCRVENDMFQNLIEPKWDGTETLRSSAASPNMTPVPDRTVFIQALNDLREQVIKAKTQFLPMTMAEFALAATRYLTMPKEHRESTILFDSDR